MTGERDTRQHRRGQRRLDEFQVKAPLGLDSLGKLELQPLENIPTPSESAGLAELRAWARRVTLEHKDKGMWR